MRQDKPFKPIVEGTGHQNDELAHPLQGQPRGDSRQRTLG
jgi:hypothetical protein